MEYYECTYCHHKMAVRQMKAGYNQYNCEYCGSEHFEFESGK